MLSGTRIARDKSPASSRHWLVHGSVGALPGTSYRSTRAHVGGHSASDREHDLPGAMEAAWKSVASALTDRQAQEGSASSAQLDVGVMLSRLSRNMLAGVQRNKAVLM